MSRYKKIICAATLFFVSAVSAPGQDKVTLKPDLSLDRNLFLEIARTQPVLRDKLLESRLRSFVEGKGLIQAVIDEERYRCKKCLIVQDRESLKYGINLRYHIFIKDDEEAKAQSGMTLQFRGQYMAYTPVDSSKKVYILDVIYESGTVVVDE